MTATDDKLAKARKWLADIRCTMRDDCPCEMCVESRVERPMEPVVEKPKERKQRELFA